MIDLFHFKKKIFIYLVKKIFHSFSDSLFQRNKFLQNKFDYMNIVFYTHFYQIDFDPEYMNMWAGADIYKRDFYGGPDGEPLKFHGVQKGTPGLTGTS